MIIFSFYSCQNEPLIPEPKIKKAGQQLPPGIVMQISYNEKTLRTSSQWPKSIVGGLRKTNDAEELLIDFQNVKTLIEIDTVGQLSTEVDYIESNADTHMPLELYDAIKDKINPPAPDDNPMTRYTINKGNYTAYGADGSIICTAQFPEDDISFLIDTTGTQAGTNARIGLTPVSKRDNRPLSDIINNYRSKGIQCSLLGENEIIVEKNLTSQTKNLTAKAVFDARTGLLKRNAIYNNEGRLLNAEIFGYKNVDGYYFPATIVGYEMGNLSDGSWGIKTKTIKARTALKIVVNNKFGRK